MKMCRKSILRFIAAFLAFIYCFENIVWADGLAPAVPISNPLSKSSKLLTQSPEQRHLRFEGLIPSNEMGQVKAIHQGAKDQTIVLIQDLHVQEEAQRNIANILDFLAQKHSLDLVGIEGASGELNTQLFSVFSDTDAKKDVADYYLKEGRLSGSEYSAIVSQPQLKLTGIEDEDLYKENLKSYLEVSQIREESLKILGKTKKITQQAGRFILSDELRQLFRERETFLKESNATLKNYVGFLLASSKNFLPHTSWPKCEELARLMRLQSEIHFETAPLQVDRLLKEMLPFLPQETQKELLLEQKQWQQGYAYKTLWKEARKLSRRKQGKALLKKYQHALSYLKLMMSYQQMDGSFLDEMTQLEKLLMDVWAVSPKEKSLMQLYLVIEAYENMFRLSMTKQDMEWFYDHRTSFRSRSFREILEPIMKQYHFSDALPENLELLETYLPRAEKFYELAAQRDQALISRAVNVMNKNNARLMAVVIGGFHTSGAERFLKKNGYSYIVLSPAIKNSWNEKELIEKYEKALNGQSSLFNSFFEKVIKEQNTFYQLSPRPLTPLLGEGLNDSEEVIFLLLLRSMANHPEPYEAAQEIIEKAEKDQSLEAVLNRLNNFGNEDAAKTSDKASRRFFFLNKDGTFNLIEFLPKNGRTKSFKELYLRRGAYPSRIFGLGIYRVVMVQNIPSELVPSNIAKQWESNVIEKKKLLASARCEVRKVKQFIPGQVEGAEQRVLLSGASGIPAEMGSWRGEGEKIKIDLSTQITGIEAPLSSAESKLKIDRDPQNRIVLIEQAYQENGKEIVETTTFEYEENNRLSKKVFIRKKNGETIYSEIIPKGKFLYDAKGDLIGFKSVREVGGKVFFGMGTYLLDDHGKPIELRISLEDFQRKLSLEIWKYKYGKSHQVILSASQEIYTKDPESVSLLALSDAEKVVEIIDFKHHPVEVPVQIKKRAQNGETLILKVKSQHTKPSALSHANLNGLQNSNPDQTNHGVVFPQLNFLPPGTHRDPLFQGSISPRRHEPNPVPVKKNEVNRLGFHSSVSIPSNEVPDFVTKSQKERKDNSTEEGRIEIPDEDRQGTAEKNPSKSDDESDDEIEMKEGLDLKEPARPIVPENDNSTQPGRIEIEEDEQFFEDFDSGLENHQPENTNMPVSGAIEAASGPHFLIKSLLFILYYIAGESMANLFIYFSNSPTLNNISTFNFFHILDFFFSTSLGDDLAKSGRLLASLSLIASPFLHLFIYIMAWIEVLFLKGIPFIKKYVAKNRLKNEDLQQENIPLWKEYRLAFDILRACKVIPLPGKRDPIGYSEAVFRSMPAYYLLSFLLMLAFPKMFTTDFSWVLELYDYLFGAPHSSRLISHLFSVAFVIPLWLLRGNLRKVYFESDKKNESSYRSELRNLPVVSKKLAPFLLSLGLIAGIAPKIEAYQPLEKPDSQVLGKSASSGVIQQVKLNTAYDSVMVPYSSIETREEERNDGVVSKKELKITGYYVNSPIAGRVTPSAGIAKVQEKAKNNPSLITAFVREGTHICFVTDSKLELEVKAAEAKLNKTRKELIEFIKLRKKRVNDLLTLADANPSGGAGLIERYLREGLVYAEKFQRLQAVKGIVAPEDGEVIVETLPKEGNVNQKDSLFTFIPANRFSTQFALSTGAFQELLNNQFNMVFEVQDESGKWNGVQIQKIKVTLVPDREPYVIIEANLFWTPQKGKDIRKRPTVGRWKILPNPVNESSITPIEGKMMTTTGVVKKRDHFPVVASEISGPWLPAVDEMTLLEGGKIIGRNDGVKELAQALSALKKYGQFSQGSINLFSPRSLRQAQAENLPRVWDSAGFGESRGPYALLWDIVGTEAERQRLIAMTPISLVKVKNTGVYVSNPALVRQPVLPAQEVGKLLSGLVHIGDIKIPKQQGFLPKKNDLVKITSLTGQTYIGAILQADSFSENRNGQNLKEEYIINDVLVPNDLLQVLGLGEPVKVEIFSGRNAKQQMQEILKRNISALMAKPFSIEYQLGETHVSTALKLLKKSDDEAFAILEEADSLNRIQDTTAFLSQKNHTETFNREVQRLILQNDSLRLDQPYRNDVAQLVILYLRDQGKIGITKLMNCLSEIEKNPKADFAKELIYQVIEDAVRKDPALLVAFIRESRFTEKSLRQNTENFFLKMVLRNPQDPASIMALRAFWDDDEIGKYSHQSFLFELQRRKQVQAMETFALGYLLPAVEGKTTLAPLPEFVAEEGILRFARQADARLLLMYAGTQEDWEGGLDPDVRSAAQEAVSKHQLNREASIDMSALLGAISTNYSMQEDFLFDSWDEETRKQKLTTLKSDDLARLLKIPKYAPYYRDIRDQLIKKDEGITYLAEIFIQLSRIDRNKRSDPQKQLLEFLIEKEFGLEVLLLTEIETFEKEMDRAIQLVLTETANKKEGVKSDKILLSTTHAAQKAGLLNLYLHALLQINKENPDLELMAAILRNVPSKFQLGDIFKGKSAIFSELKESGVDLKEIRKQIQNEILRRSLVEAIDLIRQKFGIGQAEPGIQKREYLDLENVVQKIADHRVDVQDAVELLESMKKKGSLDPEIYDELTRYSQILSEEIYSGNRFAPDLTVKKNPYFWIILIPIGLIGIGALIGILATWRSKRKIEKDILGARAMSSFDSRSEVRPSSLSAKTLRPQVVNSEPLKRVNPLYEDSDLQRTLEEWRALIDQNDELSRFDISRLLNLVTKARRDKKIHFSLRSDFLNHLDPDLLIIVEEMLSYLEETQKKIQTNILELDAKSLGTKESELRMKEMTLAMKELSYTAQYLVEFELIVNMLISLKRIPESYALTWLKVSPTDPKRNHFWTKFKIHSNRIGSGIFAFVRLHLFISPPAWRTRTRLIHHLEQFEQKADLVDRGLYLKHEWADFKAEIPKVFISVRDVSHMPIPVLMSEWAKLGRRLFFLIFAGDLPLSILIFNYFSNLNVTLQPYLWIAGPLAAFGLLTLLLAWTLHLWPMVAIFVGRYSEEHQYYKTVFNAYEKWAHSFNVQKRWQTDISLASLEEEWTQLALDRELDLENPASIHIVALIHRDELSSEQEKRYRALLEPLLRNKDSLVFIRQEISGSGGAYLSAKRYLQKNLEALKGRLKLENKDEKKLGIAYLLAGAEPTNILSLIQGEDRYIPRTIKVARQSLRGTTTRFALINAYKQAQQIQGGEFILPTNTDNDAPQFVAASGITLGSAFVSHAQIKEQNLGIILQPFETTVMKLVEKLKNRDYFLREALTRNHALRYFLNIPINDEEELRWQHMIQWPAFDGNLAMGSESVSGEIFNAMLWGAVENESGSSQKGRKTDDATPPLSKIYYETAQRLSKEHPPFSLNLTLDFIIPALLIIHGEDLNDYLNTRTKGMDSSLESGYKKLAKILKEIIERKVAIRKKGKKEKKAGSNKKKKKFTKENLRFYHFPGYLGQTTFSNVTSPYFWSALYREKKESETNFPDGLDLITDFRGAQILYRVAPLSLGTNMIAAHLTFSILGEKVRVNYVAGSSDTLLGNSLLGKPWPKIRPRLVDRNGEGISPKNERLEDVPLYPKGDFNPEDFQWMRPEILNGNAPIVFNKTRIELERERVSAKWIRENRKHLNSKKKSKRNSEGLPSRSELRKAVLEGLESVQNQTLAARVLDEKARKLDFQLGEMIKQILEERYKIDLDEEKTFDEGYYMFEYDPAFHSPEKVKELLSLMPPDVRFILTVVDSLSLETKKNLYLQMKQVFGVAMADRKNILTAFYEPEWSNYKLIQRLQKKMGNKGFLYLNDSRLKEEISDQYRVYGAAIPFAKQMPVIVGRWPQFIAGEKGIDGLEVLLRSKAQLQKSA